MSDTYTAYFARRRGRGFHGVGEMELDLYEGNPLDEVIWSGERWIRISDVRGGGADYIPLDALR